MSIIKHIKHSSIDFDKWDKAISNSLQPLVSAQSFYLNATCPNWDALMIGDYETVFPLTFKKKLSITYLYQPAFTPQLGCYGKLTVEIEQLFYNYITKHFKLIEIELNATNKIQSPFVFSKKTFIINYKNGFTFNQNTKRNISKAITNGFKVEQIISQHIITLSTQFLNPFLIHDLKLTKKDTSILNNLLQNSISNNVLISFKVVNNANKIIALAHFVYNKNQVLFLKGTNFDKIENTGSMHLLLSHAIHFFADKCICFDFGGGSLNEGLANFYKGFGAHPLHYSFLQLNNLPKLIKVLKH